MTQRILSNLAALCLVPQLIAARPNILFITVDDMNCDSVGAFGCRLPDTTPHIDRLARQGIRFNRAHVVVGNCMPSRNCMLSGRYPHNNRVEGFYQVPDKDYPVLCDLMKDAGYFTAIRGKVSHSTPFSPYDWDLVLDNTDGNKEHPKDVASYHRSTAAGIAAARKADRPFCLVINVSDPHKPFYATDKRGEPTDDPHQPSRTFSADEVHVPGFLFDDPEVRRELAQYYSTVRRADDCVGEILRALQESGQDRNTIVVFLSDHGMPLPFAKTAVYHHSTRTPLIVRWPDMAKPGARDDHHMVSSVDILPTFLDFAGIPQPAGIDGRSFAPLVRGQQQDQRDFVIKEYNENSGGARHPMRSIQTRRFCYIYNPWSDGRRVFKTATRGTLTYRRMQALAATDTAVAARLELFDHRVPEEFYDIEKDPDCQYNLINEPTAQKELNRHRKLLESWMAQTGDHVLPVFQQRGNPAIAAAYLERVEKESAARRAAQPKGKGGRRTTGKLIRLQIPESIIPGQPAVVRVAHQLPPALGIQKLHVTLKAGRNLARVDRQIVEIKGRGTAEITFAIPAEVKDRTVAFAAFVGAEYSQSLQHLATKPIPLK
jgi:N-sulfoglucosamine sulfohydrolase